MITPQPAAYKTDFVDLPLARLHILETGTGEPLIMVPATISELENWLTLAQFMAQWFHVYFFELPGHGQSTPFQSRFSSQQVAELVEQLANALGFDHFNLMGFSFGGILAMRTFIRLSTRIERLILIAPCLGRRALPFSPLRWYGLYLFNRLLEHPYWQARFCDLIHRERTIGPIIWILQKFGKVEGTIPLREKLLRTSASTVSVLNAQINEILTTEFNAAATKYPTPCYFAMSIYDPLLKYQTTLNIVHQHFANINSLRLTYPFHQPPRPFTYNELNQTFFDTVDAFMSSENMLQKS